MIEHSFRGEYVVLCKLKMQRLFARAEVRPAPNHICETPQGSHRRRWKAHFTLKRSITTKVTMSTKFTIVIVKSDAVLAHQVSTLQKGFLVEVVRLQTFSSDTLFPYNSRTPSSNKHMESEVDQMSLLNCAKTGPSGEIAKWKPAEQKLGSSFTPCLFRHYQTFQAVQIRKGIRLRRSCDLRSQHFRTSILDSGFIHAMLALGDYGFSHASIAID